MSVLKKQLQMLSNYKALVDSDQNKCILDAEDSIIFYKQEKSNNNIKIIFENYFIYPFEGFDFHDKYNKGIPPYSKEMVGKILKETEKMYYFKGHSLTDPKIWEGWVPKKSCIVKGDN